MSHNPVATGKRRPVNLSLDAEVVAAARAEGLNLSQVCEAALRNAAKTERDRRWKEENREAIEANNAWVEQHGLPLAKYRLF